ncbi:hypothetical protein CLOHYLEM_04988 [[Clostridium] hylemonae DSM 15053]|uniref:Uncharacterized protein n=1 Tax=[Clostridium] hylemonae DSM 15053 TaxID=553973 RepID=C0BYU9_9FIRM|nr:hypothetical protein CLOHYLEM_04988 [[Clostridium] hylemonae DSM 15053]
MTCYVNTAASQHAPQCRAAQENKQDAETRNGTASCFILSL